MSEDDSGTTDGQRGATRRTMMRAGGVGIASAVGVTGMATRIASADVQVYGSDTDTVDTSLVSVGAELAASGPDVTSVQDNECGIAWGISTADSIDSKVENIQLEFIPTAYLPSDNGFDIINKYGQGDGTERRIIEYAVNTLWSLANIPVPSPLSLVPGSGDSLTFGPDFDSFTVDYPRFYDEKLGGVDFYLKLGVDGELTPGTYNFNANLTADVYYSDPYVTTKEGELSCSVPVSIEVE